MTGHPPAADRSARRRLGRAVLLPLAGIGAALTLAACGGSDPLAGDGSTGGSGDTVTVGSADFPESQIIAEIYAGALRAEGVDAQTSNGIGAREAYIGALEDGSVDLVPEYSGNLLLYVDPESEAASEEEIMAELDGALPEGLSVLEPAEAQSRDAVVVTRQTAEEGDLTSIADLAPRCSELTFAGPPEFRERAYGLEGLKENYGCEFGSFEPVSDGGGPLTTQALVSGDADAANIFTTSPALQEHDLVVLEDPEYNFIAQQVLPLVAADRLPDDAEAALDGVSQKLTTEDLIELNQAVSGDDAESPKDAAVGWLEDNGYAVS